MRLSKPLLSYDLERNTRVACPRCHAAMYLYPGGGDFVVRCWDCDLRMSLARVIIDNRFCCYRLEYMRHGQNQ